MRLPASRFELNRPLQGVDRFIRTFGKHVDGAERVPGVEIAGVEGNGLPFQRFGPWLSW